MKTEEDNDTAAEPSKAAQEFQFDLAHRGGTLRFSTSDDLATWIRDERKAWQWLGESRTVQISELSTIHGQCMAQLDAIRAEWEKNKAEPDKLKGIYDQFCRILENHYCERKIVYSRSADGRFLAQLREDRGEEIAIAAYTVLARSSLNLHGNQRRTALSAGLLIGTLEGWLYDRSIDWASGAQREVFDDLSSDYQAAIQEQDRRFAQIVAKNQMLNDEFAKELKEKSESLGNLQVSQDQEFRELVEKHVKNLVSIESTYDQKLALQKPVEYWKTKERYHAKRSLWFGISAIVVGLLCALGTGGIIYWVFSRLPVGGDPKSWELGVLLVGAFFGIWFTRVVVRLFFSHLHLATDASERRTMILTYLAMSREGSQFAPEDKGLIIQHLFRSASDGLVKDDAAPATPLEWLTRK